MTKSFRGPNADTLLKNQLDITAPNHGVEVQISGNRVWINVDGICLLRICQIPETSVQFEGKTLKFKERYQ